MKHKFYRPTWAEINLNNLTHNLNQIRRIITPATKIMVTVKADAYGHGLIPVSKRLVLSGVDFLAVASIDEGIKLRRAKISAPILILGLTLRKDIGPLFKYKLTATVCDEELAAALNNKGRLLSSAIDVHIKVDTGMGRIGILHQDAQGLIRKIHKFKFINIQGIFTHFPLADVNKYFTLRQIDLFNRLIKNLKSEGINIPLVHTANSVGIIDYQTSHFNLVRPGLAIYGLGSGSIHKQINLKPVLNLKTKVMFVKRVPKGFGISYGHDYITKKETKIVTLPIGYGDGYPRSLSNKAFVLIRGKRFKVCGRICMDQLMVDVGEESVKVEDEVMLIGPQGKHKITVEELALLSGAIPYEIVCGLGNRIPRIYI